MSERLWEVDVARTIAILMMVVYHIGYDADLLGPERGHRPLQRRLAGAAGGHRLVVPVHRRGEPVDLERALPRRAGSPAGPSTSATPAGPARCWRPPLLVSIVTLIALGDDYVRFGILHCIAVTMLILPLLVRLAPPLLLVLGVAVIAAGIALVHDGPRSDAIGLLALGFRRTGTEGVNWYPLLPWLGPAILGLAAGAVLYPDGRRGRWGRRLPTPSHARALGWPGRHALPIYLVHQIVLIALVAGSARPGRRGGQPGQDDPTRRRRR